MLGKLKTLFANEFKDAMSSGNANQPHRLHIATCAILLEMAKIDGEFSDSERQNIISILKKNYHLADDEVSALIEASEEELEKSIDLWHFTNKINENYSPEEKMHIIETVWQVAFADGRLDQHEDYLMHKLAELLNIPHKHLIDAKLRVLQRSKV